MSITHAQKMKSRKRKNRELKLKKVRNINRNLPAEKYRLDVLDGDRWLIGLRHFRSVEGLDKYKAQVEQERKMGKTILPARVVHIAANKIVFEIAGSELKGKLPDTISEGPKANPDVKA